jgi:hypothetical protein
MEVMENDGGNGKNGSPEQEAPKKSHEDYLREFAQKLNDILKEGYPLPPVIQVLDSALFEMRMSLYFQQMEMAERQKQMEKHIEIPRMTIPTNKRK